MMRTAAILAALALLAGCGGGGGNGDNGGGGDENQVGEELAYNMGFQQCDGYPVSDLAATYNTKTTPEAVAEAVARATPASPNTLEFVRKGCLDGLKK
jgi:hypothetical protein